MTKFFVLSAILILISASGVHRIGPGERAVVRRFGKVVAHPGPGFRLGLPWGIDRFDKVSALAARRLDIGADPNSFDSQSSGQFLTGDKNIVEVRLVVEYSVGPEDSDLDLFVAHTDRVEELLTRETESAAAEWFAARAVDDVLLHGRAEAPDWIAARLTPVAAKVGVEPRRVSVDHLAAPREVVEAFEEVNRARTAIRTREDTATREAIRMTREAESLRFSLERQAEAHRIDVLASASAEAESFNARLARYQESRTKNPDILSAMWWDEMSRMYGEMKSRGRIDLLDHRLGPDGLDITQFYPTKK